MNIDNVCSSLRDLGYTATDIIAIIQKYQSYISDSGMTDEEAIEYISAKENIAMYTPLLLDILELVFKSRFSKNFVLKGGLDLSEKLKSEGLDSLLRVTRDIDLHCNSWEAWIDFTKAVDEILSHSTKYTYSDYSLRSTCKDTNQISDTLHITAHNILTKEVTAVKIDMNVKDDSIIEIDLLPGLGIPSYSYYTILSDKINVVSSKLIYRRIKDLYDLYAIVSTHDIEASKLNIAIDKKHDRSAFSNMLTGDNFNDLVHAYDSFKGISTKPNFDEVFSVASNFLCKIYSDYPIKEWKCKNKRWD